VVWARVRISMTAPRVIAAEPLKPGRPITDSQVRIETRDVLPGVGPAAASIEEVAGRVPRRNIRAGEVIDPAWLDAARDVSRGQPVRVDVWSGSAHLEFDAEAQASGSVGQTIPLRNPVSNRRFLGRIEGNGRVSVRRDNP
jgi:flagella basal body P-ring formation protein FlgA